MILDNGTTHLSDIIDRHRAFWHREPVDRPLSNYTPVHTYQPRAYPLRDGQFAYDPRCITADDIDIDLLVGYEDPLPPLLSGDMFFPLGCEYPEAWMEAFIGCPIYVSAFGCVSKPVVEDINIALARFSIDEAMQSPWLPVAESALRRARTRAGDDYPVKQIHTRGVVDMLAAYLGEATLCMALLDEPMKVCALAEQFADLFLQITDRILPLPGAWHGGMVSEWSLYAPGLALDYQADASSLISPGIYREYLLQFDRKVLGSFPYSLLHLHACGLQHLDMFVSCNEVNVIEISCDRETGDWNQADLLKAFQTVQRNGKPLLVNSEMSEEEYQVFTEALDPAGLAVVYFGELRASVKCP